MQRTGQGRPQNIQRFNNRFNNREMNQNPTVIKKFVRKPTGTVQNRQVQNKNPNRDAVIAKNLQQLKFNSQKKKVAQERYYGAGRSPMVKNASGHYVKQESRISVQQRLGLWNGTATPRTNPRANVNRPNVNRAKPNTNQFYINKKIQPNTPGNFRTNKIVRAQNYQNKRVLTNNNMNTNGMIKTIGSNGQVLFLRPSKTVPVRKTYRKPANLSVRVENDGRHHIQQDLNPILQNEIKLIQSNGGRQVVEPELAYNDRLPPMATKKTLNERFSMF